MRFHPHSLNGKPGLAVEHDGHAIELVALDEKFPHELGRAEAFGGDRDADEGAQR
jgi:hypothetical protein